MSGDHDNQRRVNLFEQRIALGLRELDGQEQQPDVSSAVMRRLHEPEPALSRGRFPTMAVAVALLAVLVTATLIVWENAARGSGDSVPVIAPQDPVGPWRLLYELPVDELQRAMRDNREEDLEQVLARCVRMLEIRLGTRGIVKRSDATKFTVDLANASSSEVASVRTILEDAGRLEMRMLADDDYLAAGVRFRMQAEQERLAAWLDEGNRQLVQKDPAVIAKYRSDNAQLRWFVRRVWPSASRAGRWDVRYADLHLGVVAAHAEADWNDGVIPAHIQAKPIAERFLVELFPINMHERHFGTADLDPTKVALAGDQGDGLGFGVDYRLRAEQASNYADFSEKWIGRHCAMIWDGEVLSAPRFESRIPGAGRISALSQQQADAIVAALRAPLPVKPRLLRSQSR